MFDGINQVVLPVNDPTALLRLYRDLMGFTLESDQPAVTGIGDLWALPLPVTRELLLTKPGASGGSIRIAVVPGLPPAIPAGRPDRFGPYALDFYLRDAAAFEAECVAAGQRFVTEAVHYSLPGTEIPVRERMLLQDESGLLHAFVQHRPRGTRCVLDSAAHEQASEVAAAVFMTEHFEEAREFARTVLGGHEYFTGRFDGTAVEQMLALAPGEGFDAALYRGPTSANARLEFGRSIASDRQGDPVPRVVARVAVDDLEATTVALASGQHGRMTQRMTIDGVPHVGLASRYGAVFDLHERRR